MREIKFEYGFESVNGIIKKVYSLSEITNIQQKCDVWNVLPIKYVRQFTGLKDVNGKEVYEGDILKGETTNPFASNKVLNYKVIWGKDSWHIEKTYMSLQALFNHCDNGIEIIGNIFENPNLL